MSTHSCSNRKSNLYCIAHLNAFPIEKDYQPAGTPGRTYTRTFNGKSRLTGVWRLTPPIRPVLWPGGGRWDPVSAVSHLLSAHLVSVAVAGLRGDLVRPVAQADTFGGLAVGLCPLRHVQTRVSTAPDATYTYRHSNTVRLN